MPYLWGGFAIACFLLMVFTGELLWFVASLCLFIAAFVDDQAENSVSDDETFTQTPSV